MRKLSVLLLALMAVLCLASCDNSLSAPVVPTDEEAQRIERDASVIMNFVLKHDEPIVVVEGNTYTVNENRNYGAGYIIRKGTVVTLDQTTGYYAIDGDYSLNGGSHTLEIEAQLDSVNQKATFSKCVFDGTAYDMNTYYENA